MTKEDDEAWFDQIEKMENDGTKPLTNREWGG